jgi:hypothetical protein
MTHVSKLRTKTGSNDFPLINGQFLWAASFQFTVPRLGINLAAAGFRRFQLTSLLAEKGLCQ